MHIGKIASKEIDISLSLYNKKVQVLQTNLII